MASPFISFSAAELDPAKLERVLADHVELEQARVFRQLLVKRLALIATTAWILARWLHVLTRTQLLTVLGTFSAVGVVAFAVELRVRRRLTRALDGVDMTAAARAQREEAPRAAKPAAFHRGPCGKS